MSKARENITDYFDQDRPILIEGWDSPLCIHGKPVTGRQLIKLARQEANKRAKKRVDKISKDVEAISKLEGKQLMSIMLFTALMDGLKKYLSV